LNPVDVIIVAAVLIGFILGYKDGFVRKLIGIIGFALAIISAAVLKDDLGRLIENAFGMEFYLAEITGGVLIFFTIILIFTLLKRVIHPFDKVNNLINQLIGGVVGVIQLLYFLSAIFLLLNVFDIPGKNVKNESAFYSDTYQIIPVTIEFLNSYTPQTKEIFEEYMKDQDSTG
jgi:membrane protein required for colicin V production